MYLHVHILQVKLCQQFLERIEMKRKEMMKSLDSLKEELTELKNKQNSIDLKRQEIQKVSNWSSTLFN